VGPRIGDSVLADCRVDQIANEGNVMPVFAGLDCYSYPGDATLAWLKANTNLVFCGYYLGPSPSHHDTSWMGKQASMVAAGWGIAPVYLGQQTIPPGSLNPSTATGQVDGQQAAGYMASEGFPAGSYVYLDLENGPPLSQPQQDYVVAWSAAVAAGGYSAGVYCSHLMAAQVAALQVAKRIWAFKIPGQQLPLTSPYPEVDPGGSGFPAHIWQLAQNYTIQTSSDASTKLEVDLNSALSADPSAPDVAVAS